MKILVTGGAGYIGSHCVYKLLREGYEVSVIDNLSKGHRKAVCDGARLYVGDISDGEFVDSVLEEEKVEAVMHFAAFSLVGESMTDPGKYFLNNLGGSVSLFESMRRNRVNKIIFSSTAAVYGQPEIMPIAEDSPLMPTNAYGESKLMVEKALDWYRQAFGMQYVALRYFNVAGAIGEAGIGEDHRPETHLIPNVLKSAIKGESVEVFGDDYDTPDGTCIRDYLHVEDLIDAHIAALHYLEGGGKPMSINLGTGKGYSVKEIIAAAEQSLGIKIKNKVVARRAGDPAVLVASGRLAAEVLGFTPKYGIEDMCASAFEWHKNNPDGFGE